MKFLGFKFKSKIFYLIHKSLFAKIKICKITEEIICLLLILLIYTFHFLPSLILVFICLCLLMLLICTLCHAWCISCNQLWIVPCKGACCFGVLGCHVLFQLVYSVLPYLFLLFLIQIDTNIYISIFSLIKCKLVCL